MRLDKFLCEMNTGTRTQVKDLVRQGLVTVNGVVEKCADRKIDENKDNICLRGMLLSYSRFVYYMLNKPQGVVSATEDRLSKTVIELLKEEDRRPGLFPAGRLDKDTEGFLLLTNDGELAHRLLSPAKHVDKAYLVTTEKPLSPEAVFLLTQGVDIGEKKPTLPATVEVLEENRLLLTIREGKYHQIKRMLQAVGNQVTALKRVSFGGVLLDGELLPGEYRRLTKQEVEVLYGT